MFGTLGGPEILLILAIALIVFGPRKLPEIGKSVGKMLAEFRKASTEFRRTIEDEVEAEKIREATRIPPVSSAALPAQPPPAAQPADADAGAATEGADPAAANREPEPAAVSREPAPPLEAK